MAVLMAKILMVILMANPNPNGRSNGKNSSEYLKRTCHRIWYW